MPCLRGSVGPGNTLHIILRRCGNTWLTDKLCCVFSRTGLDIYVFGLQGKLVNAASTVSPEQDSNPTSSTWRRQPGQTQLLLRCHGADVCVCAQPAGSPSGRALPTAVLLDPFPALYSLLLGRHSAPVWPGLLCSGFCFQRHLNRLDFFSPLALSECLIGG